MLPPQPKEDLNKFRNINYDIENNIDKGDTNIWDTIPIP